jgi:outer membrane biosynthesis protein TonB
MAPTPDNEATYTIMSLRLGGCKALCEHTLCVMHALSADTTGEAFAPSMEFRVAADGALGDIVCTSFASSEPKPVAQQEAEAKGTPPAENPPASTPQEPSPPSTPQEPPSKPSTDEKSEDSEKSQPESSESETEKMSARERRAAEKAKDDKKLDLGDE